ncbi:MAG: tetratricopeptide repeat protein [Elusimicrobiota bacterium]
MKIKIGVIFVIFIFVGGFFLYKNSSEQKSLKYLEKGNKFLKTGKYIEAILEYQKAVPLKPSKKISAELHYNIATGCLALAQYSSAIMEYKKVVLEYKDSPFSDDAQFITAMIFDERLGNKKRAKQEFKFYLDNFPKAKYSFEARRKLLEK